MTTDLPAVPHVPLTRERVWDTAATLLSEDGENPEYDRAITELVADLFGYVQDEYPAVLSSLIERRDSLATTHQHETTAVAVSDADTRTVLVLNWVYWDGDEQGGGGFDWFEAEHRDYVLNQGFPREVKAWAGCPARVRVVEVEVPKDLTGQDLTDLLDGELHDYVEIDAPAIVEHDTSPRQDQGTGQ